MNPALVILTSVVVSAVVSSIFSLTGQAIERRARQRELIFLKAVEMAKMKVDFALALNERSGRASSVADYPMYAEVYFTVLEHLYKSGKLPEGWQHDAHARMREFSDISSEIGQDRMS